MSIYIQLLENAKMTEKKQHNTINLVTSTMLIKAK